MIKIDGREILETLDEKVAPDHAAVIVIDCQHEFIGTVAFGMSWAKTSQRRRSWPNGSPAFWSAPGSPACGSSTCVPSMTATT